MAAALLSSSVKTKRKANVVVEEIDFLATFKLSYNITTIEM